MSQSPSLRGSGRFSPTRRRSCSASASLNPLHCGAVVASAGLLSWWKGYLERSQSPSLRGSGRFVRPSPLPYGRGGVSQSPSLRGSGRFARDLRRRPWRISPVSIPFIAGQWSLPAMALWWAAEMRCLNPLHCGAVVASRPWTRSEPGDSSLNPLHCGAVVASRGVVLHAPAPDPVSIPFIAGQWSLPSRISVWVATHRVSIPFIAGQWSLRERPRLSWNPTLLVSIPFIAGQWSLPSRSPGTRNWPPALSQSPSLRGSGRFS